MMNGPFLSEDSFAILLIPQVMLQVKKTILQFNFILNP